MTDDKEMILAELNKLIDQAEQERKILRASVMFDSIDFTPNELREHNAKGEFIWGVVNWHLIDPADIERELKNVVDKAAKNLDKFQSKISNAFNEK